MNPQTRQCSVAVKKSNFFVHSGHRGPGACHRSSPTFTGLKLGINSSSAALTFSSVLELLDPIAKLIFYLFSFPFLHIKVDSGSTCLAGAGKTF
jgi:hypothetical protein